MTYFTATGAGSKIGLNGAKLVSFQAAGATTADAGAATLEIEVSNTGKDNEWLQLAAGPISLTLSTTPATAAIILDEPWVYARGNCTAISGTGAYVTLSIGA
jgi:hypothetical protein